MFCDTHPSIPYNRIQQIKLGRGSHQVHGCPGGNPFFYLAHPFVTFQEPLQIHSESSLKTGVLTALDAVIILIHWNDSGCPLARVNISVIPNLVTLHCGHKNPFPFSTDSSWREGNCQSSPNREAAETWPVMLPVHHLPVRIEPWWVLQVLHLFISQLMSEQ